MKILHAHYSMGEPGLIFWVESSDAPPPNPSRGRTSKTPKSKPHPYSQKPDINGESRTISLHLPSVKGIPLPSPQLIHPWNIDSENAVLAPFDIEGTFLPVDEAIDLFMVVSSNQANSVIPYIPSPAFRYWNMVSSLALEAIAAQKFIPVIDGGDARWLPVLDSPNDARRLQLLETSIPPVCRSEANTDGEYYSTKILTTSFLNIVCDYLIRIWGKSNPPNFHHLDNDTIEWIKALFNQSPSINLKPNQFRHLATSHQNWMRNLYVAGDSSFRVAFRLEAPESQNHPWQLHYLIQAKDDPSLLISADKVWKKTKGALTYLNHRFEQPQEKLLSGLGYASRLFPPISDSLRDKCPTELAVDSHGAYTFLRETAPILEGAGFGVLVPPWWNKKGARLGAKVKMKSKSDSIPTGRLALDKLVDYQWQLSIGETELTEEEFQALANLKSPLVQIRGQWVTLDAEQIDAAIKFWEKQKNVGDMNLLEALHLGLGGEDSVGGLPITVVETDSLLSEWLDRFSQSDKLEVLPQPDGLVAELRPYQRYGYSWLDFLRKWGLGACLADDMGLGKTIQTISLLVREKELTGKLPYPALLIAPTSVVTNWEREIDRFAPILRTYIHRGADRLKGSKFRKAIKDHDMVLTSYPLARLDAETLQSIRWLAVILDEAQNIKNPETKQTQAIRKFEGDFRIALTGTPVENRLSELWSIMHFLNPGYLGTRKAFRENFSLPIERYQDEDSLLKLRQLTAPFILRRVKTDPSVITDLPEKVETKVFCTLTEEQATLYEAVVKDVIRKIESAEEGIQRRGLVLSMLMQLKQICNHPVQYLHQIGDGNTLISLDGRSGKLERLGELLEEILAEGDRALIFTQFFEMGEILAKHLPASFGADTQFLHGGTPTKIRDQMVRRFQEDDQSPPVFILSLKAGGTGLNLTRANHVFHFDRWWNPAVEDQATDRAFRIGQKRNVQVHKFVTTGTLEEMIDDMIESKKGLAQAVVGSGENWLTELSTDELREVVSLRRL